MNNINSSSSTSDVEYTIFTEHEESSDDESSEESNNDIMPIIADVTSIDLPKTEKSSSNTRTSMEYYGPVCVRKRCTVSLTLATGRRKKHAILEGEDAEKLELRRIKNRESARNLKKYRETIEHDLAAQINELESEEKKLLTNVHTLRTYKRYLEEQCQHASHMSETTK